MRGVRFRLLRLRRGNQCLWVESKYWKGVNDFMTLTVDFPPACEITRYELLDLIKRGRGRYEWLCS